jgi:TP901 family phage tail tape measure protein
MGMESIYKLGVIVSAVDKLTGPTRKMIKSVQNLEDNMKRAQKTINFGKKMTTTGAAVTGAAVTMGAGLKSLLSPAMEVKTALQKLESQAAPSIQNLDKFMGEARKSAVAWSKDHSDSASSYIETTMRMVSAGLDAKASIAATNTALTVAKATMADSAATGELLAKVYNNMGNQSADVNQEMARLGDILTRTQQMFQLKDLGQLQEGLKNAMPSAKAFGVSVEELNTVIGSLNMTMEGAEAGTVFKSSINKMLTASKDLNFEIARNAQGGVSYIKTLQNIQNQYGSFAKMTDATKIKFQKAFGDDGVKALQLMLSQTDKLNQSLKKIKDSKGAAFNAQKIMEADPSEQFKILFNNINALKMALSKNVLPVLSIAILNVTKFVSKLTDMAKAHPSLAKTATLIFGITTAVLAVVGPIMAVVGALTMMTGYSYKGFNNLRKGFTKLKGWASDKGLIDGIKNIGRSFRNMGATIKQMAINAAQSLKTMAINIYNMGKQAVVTAASSMKKLAISVWNFGKQAAMQAVQGLKSMALGMVQMAKKAIIAGVNAIPTLVASVWSFTTALLANPVTWVVIGVVALTAAIYGLWKNWDKVVSFLQGAWNSTVNLVVSAFNWIQDTIANTSNQALMIVSFFMPFIGLPALIIKNWDTIKNFFISLWQGIKNGAVTGIEFIKNAFIGFKNFLLTPIQLPELSWETIKTSLNGALNWVKGLFITFRNSGIGLWNAFTEGLKSVITKPKEAVQAGLQKVRNLLPFSDAKEGPLSTLTKSGGALIETLATGMKNKSNGLKGVMQGALGGVANFIKGFSLPSKLTNINAQAIYDLIMPDIPLLPDLAGEAKYALSSEGGLTSSILGSGVGNVSIPNFKQESASASDGNNDRQLIIQGDINLNVQQVNEPMDLVNALRMLKEEVGG